MDRETLATLVKIHQAEIYRYAIYLGADRSAAEDIVQETFIAAFRHASPPDFSVDGTSAAWLRGIARNMFLRHCRRIKISPVRTDSQMLKQAEQIWAGEFLRGGDGFDYLEALRVCLEKLPKKHRQIIDARYRRKQSRTDMAAEHRMTENGIKSLLRRIRTGLADCVSKRLELDRL